jgi:hypothetical protein
MVASFRSTVMPRKIVLSAEHMGGLNVVSRCGLEIKGRLPRAGRRNFLSRQ